MIHKSSFRPVAALFCAFLIPVAAPPFAQAQEAATTTQQRPTMTADAVQEAFVRVAGRVKPSVVTIYAERGSRPLTPAVVTPDKKKPGSKKPGAPQAKPPLIDPGNPDEEEDPDSEPFSGPRDPREKRAALGTGMVVRADGYILTNYHVVRGATFIRVLFNADSERPDRPVARIVGYDSESDLAVLKVDRTNLPALELADSDQVRIGEWAIAVGAPFEQAQTVTVGIISAKGRHLEDNKRLGLQDYLQTDASINPGNSGGPLVDLDGHVIGINTAILSPSRFNIGIGFSVPANTIRKYLPVLMSGKKVARGFLGIDYVRLAPEVAREFGVESGMQIGALRDIPNNPSKAAGLQEGDIITAVNDQAVEGSDQFRALVSGFDPGTTIRVSVVRPGTTGNLKLNKTITLGDFPPAQGTPDAEPTFAKPPAIADLGLELENAKDLSASDRDRLEIPADAKGPIIVDVASGSAADEAELGRGLMITRVRVDGGAWQPIATKAAFERLIKPLAPGARVLMQLRNPEKVSFYKLLIVPNA